MAKAKKKVGRPPKKDVRGVRNKKSTRCRYSISTKQKAIALHESGMSLKDIRKLFIDNEKLDKNYHYLYVVPS